MEGRISKSYLEIVAEAKKQLMSELDIIDPKISELLSLIKRDIIKAYAEQPIDPR